MLPDHAETRAYAGGKMLAAKDEGVGLITFNQPEKRNAISMEMWTGLGEILDEFAEDRSVSVVILTGAGNKAFVSGAELHELSLERFDLEQLFFSLTEGQYAGRPMGPPAAGVYPPQHPVQHPGQHPGQPAGGDPWAV